MNQTNNPLQFVASVTKLINQIKASLSLTFWYNLLECSRKEKIGILFNKF